VLFMMRMFFALVAITAAWVALRASPGLNGRDDPTNDLVRVRARLTTTAQRADLSLLSGAPIRTRAITTGAASIHARFDGSTCHVENDKGPASDVADVDCQWLVANLPATGIAAWSLSVTPASDAVVEVYNGNGGRLPQLVDRVINRADGVKFSTPVNLLRDGAPLPIGTVGAPRVFAFYYPWYLHATWDSDPLLIDKSPRRYSTDQEPEVVEEFREASRAGLDGLVMSWTGVNQPLRTALSAGRKTGMFVSALLETAAARDGGHKRNPIDPQIMSDWIVELVDRYGADTTFFSMGGRPVLFVYAAALLEPAVWREMLANIRATGRNPIVIAETTNTAWLDSLDGAFRYATAELSADALSRFNLAQTLGVRGYHLLPRADNAARRIWAATVSPGYDDTNIPTRTTPILRDRAGGAYYDSQWRAAIASRPDWVMVTSWNEWYENTHIETSERYGDEYVRRTAAWAKRYRCEMNPPGTRGPSDRSCDQEAPVPAIPR
jgi:Glycosyl hydrolase family 99